MERRCCRRGADATERLSSAGYEGGAIDFPRVLAVLAAIHAAGFDAINTEHSCTFDGVRGFSFGRRQEGCPQHGRETVAFAEITM